jgi:hypothetical protein
MYELRNSPSNQGGTREAGGIIAARRGRALADLPIREMLLSMARVSLTCTSSLIHAQPMEVNQVPKYLTAPWTIIEHVSIYLR